MGKQSGLEFSPIVFVFRHFAIHAAIALRQPKCRNDLIWLLEGTAWAATEFFGDGPCYSAVIKKRGV